MIGGVYLSTIVLHKPTDKKFILIGTVYELQDKAGCREPLYGSLHRDACINGAEKAVVCDNMGHISYINSDELIVLEVDGISPDKLIV